MNIYIYEYVYIYIHIDVYIHMWNYSNNHDKSQLSPTHRWNTPTSHRGRNRSGGLPGHDLEGQPSPSSHHSPAGWLKMMRKQRDNRLGYVEHVERVYEKKKKNYNNHNNDSNNNYYHHEHMKIKKIVMICNNHHDCFSL